MVVFVGCNGSGAPQEMSSKPEILVLDVVNASLNEVKEVVKKTKCATWKNLPRPKKLSEQQLLGTKKNQGRKGFQTKAP